MEFKFSRKIMIKYNLLLLFLIIWLIDSTKSQNLCNIKIADSMMSSFNGNDIIYNFGKIDELRFAKNAIIQYKAPYNKEIDFFYATEIHGVDLKKTHESVVLLFYEE
jgi:hypothetical protein